MATKKVTEKEVTTSVVKVPVNVMADKKAEEKKPAAETKAVVSKAEEKKTPTKKTAAKSTAAKRTTAKKAAVKEAISVQFDGKSYSTEDLMKIAKDVWRFDLKKKVADLKEVQLFVKPEESMVYYVINGEVNGSFSI